MAAGEEGGRRGWYWSAKWASKAMWEDWVDQAAELACALGWLQLLCSWKFYTKVLPHWVRENAGKIQSQQQETEIKLEGVKNRVYGNELEWRENPGKLEKLTLHEDLAALPCQLYLVLQEGASGNWKASGALYWNCTTAKEQMLVGWRTGKQWQRVWGLRQVRVKCAAVMGPV